MYETNRNRIKLSNYKKKPNNDNWIIEKNDNDNDNGGHTQNMYLFLFFVFFSSSLPINTTGSDVRTCVVCDNTVLCSLFNINGNANEK